MRSICVLADSSPGCRHDYQRATAELGSLLARYGCHLVYGGEATGAMRTVFEAALEAGGSATGVLPRERAEHPQHGGLAEARLSDLRLTDDRHTRTALMTELSDAVIAVPGGLETGAAFTEICTRTHLGQHHTPAALLNTSGYFNGLVNLLDQAVHDGFLNTDTRSTITVEREPVVLLERLLPTIAAH